MDARMDGWMDGCSMVYSAVGNANLRKKMAGEEALGFLLG